MIAINCLSFLVKVIRSSERGSFLIGLSPGLVYLHNLEPAVISSTTPLGSACLMQDQDVLSCMR